MLDCIAYNTVMSNPPQGLEKIIIAGKAMITDHNASIFLARSEYQLLRNLGWKELLHSYPTVDFL